uniref:Reverse transcriptase domain-containing protein n=1 Tax=Labrus bergylta TaxID=56723 RepID=A0A3Q3H2I9_9LABR
MLKDLLNKYQQAVKYARTQYFSNIIDTNCHNPRVLFSILKLVTSTPSSSSFDASVSKCQEFLQFFRDKLSGIRLSTSPPVNNLLIPSKNTSVLNSFTLITLPELHQLISSIKTSTCFLDIIPTNLLKEVTDTVGPCILLVINSSLESSHVPQSFKHAAVQPLLKKTNLDLTVLNNYRPISKLPFISKILEKTVFNQLLSHLAQNCIFDKFQSGFRARHSNETALLRITNDLLLAADSGKCSVLLLLDLTAAFDTVDHSVLIQRLNKWVGVSGTALNWFSSYLSNRSFSVSIGNFLSSSAPIPCGVPQGSILGPVLFSIYLLPLGQMFEKYNISYHCHADDTQIYLPLEPNNYNKLTNLTNCLQDVQSWMATKFSKKRSYHPSSCLLILAASQAEDWF